MYSTIDSGTASQATPQGRSHKRVEVGLELAIKDCQPDAMTIRPQHPHKGYPPPPWRRSHKCYPQKPPNPYPALLYTPSIFPF
jgi:hypothetical protein